MNPSPPFVFFFIATVLNRASLASTMPTSRARLRLLLPSDVIRNLFVIPLMSLGFVARWFISLFRIYKRVALPISDLLNDIVCGYWIPMIRKFWVTYHARQRVLPPRRYFSISLPGIPGECCQLTGDFQD